jgi:hypothetical protein
MFLDPKMVSIFLKGTIIVILVGVVTTLILYNAKLIDVCPLRQVYITEEIKKYDTTKDPELCDDLNGKISQFNNDCKAELEVLDCG